jgi:hypothetical protein
MTEQGSMDGETSRGDRLREQIVRFLGWEDAHVGFDAAVRDIPEGLRGERPPGLPHSPWELLEHLRFTQMDILRFCREPEYSEPRWPADYWPAEQSPSEPGDWDATISAFGRDRKSLCDLASDPRIDLFATIPHGSGQTYLRELLLVADHTAYHIGQLVLVRRALGIWPTS